MEKQKEGVTINLLIGDIMYNYNPTFKNEMFNFNVFAAQNLIFCIKLLLKYLKIIKR